MTLCPGELCPKLRPDLIEELPARVARLQKARFSARYSDETDTLTFRFEEEQPAYYERFDSNVYLERTIVDGCIIGLKITHYTERGEGAVEKVLIAILTHSLHHREPPARLTR
jgi:hypothetical protein